MKSYIKLWGPSLLRGLEKLEALASELPIRSEETIAPKVEFKPSYIKGVDIVAGKSVTTLGEYDFVFEWSRDPTVDDVKGLIDRIDKALRGTNCKYSITTKA